MPPAELAFAVGLAPHTMPLHVIFLRLFFSTILSDYWLSLSCGTNCVHHGTTYGFFVHPTDAVRMLPAKLTFATGLALHTMSLHMGFSTYFGPILYFPTGG